MKPFFSVIVPVYQVEQYLRQCVDSIRNQTFSDFELILVDDGSYDGCPQLCDAYAEEDGRILVIHKENEGLVRARQDGLKEASGEYILHIDSDDWIPEDLLWSAHEMLAEEPVDLICFALSYELGNFSKKDKQLVPEGRYDRENIRSVLWKKALMDEDMSHLRSNLGGKIIRKSLLWNVQFSVDPDITLGEDLLCTVPLWLAADTVRISAKTGYFYRQRENSMTKTVEFLASRREARLLEALENAKYRTEGNFEEQLDRFAAAQCFWMLVELVNHRKREMLKNLRAYIRQPVFQKRLQKAKFAGLTPKTRIAMALLKKGSLKTAYAFLALCGTLKPQTGGSVSSKDKELKIAMLGHKRVPSREGGIEVVVGELSTRMVRLGHEVTCYNRRGNHVNGKEFSTERAPEYQGVRLKSVFTINRRGFAAMTSSVAASFWAAFGAYDIVHFHAEGSCAMMWLPKLMGKRCVATIHGLDHKRAKWGRLSSAYILGGEKMAVRCADEIIVLGKEVQQYFKDTYGRATTFIPNGVNRPVLREADLITKMYGLEKDSYILSLGRLVPEKGIAYLIQAFRSVKTDKRLVIAGGASDSGHYVAELKQMAEQDPRILFTGFVQGQILEELYSNAYVFVQPSDLEGMPITLLEAMSYGNCCLTSDISEHTDVIEGHGVTFPKGNIRELAKQLQKLCDSKETTAWYQENSSEFICRKYNWDEIVQQTLALYRGEYKA